MRNISKGAKKKLRFDFAIPNWNVCVESAEPENDSHNAVVLARAHFHDEAPVYLAKAIKEHWEGLENCFCQVPVAKINLHNKKSLSNETVFSTIVLPIEKALKIFGDCEILYPKLDKYGDDDDIPCVKFGIVVED